MNSTITSVDYAALRHEGASPSRVRLQLGLSGSAGDKLEKHFQRRKWAGPRVQRPAFARHDLHVAAIAKQGGFPVLPERPR